MLSIKYAPFKFQFYISFTSVSNSVSSFLDVAVVIVVCCGSFPFMRIVIKLNVNKYDYICCH